jgi:hypothetical protein
VEIQIKGKAIVIGAAQAKSMRGYALPRAKTSASKSKRKSKRFPILYYIQLRMQKTPVANLK